MRHAAIFAVLLMGLSACTPARTGVVGNTLTTNVYPRISMSANPPLKLTGSGKLWVHATSKPRFMTLPLASLDFALFSSNSQGPVTDSAHAFIMRLEDSFFWHFAPDSWPLQQAVQFTKSLGSDNIAWTSQVLRVPAQGDWISEAWAANGRDIPVFWLAKRWASIQGESSKAVLEYREPWPAGLESLNSLSMALGGANAARVLQEFLERAGAAFTISRDYTPLPQGDGGRAITLPASMPDTSTLIGDVIPQDKGTDSDLFRL